MIVFWTHVSKVHFLAIINARNDSLALRDDVVVIDVVRQNALRYKRAPITVIFSNWYANKLTRRYLN